MRWKAEKGGGERDKGGHKTGGWILRHGTREVSEKEVQYTTINKWWGERGVWQKERYPVVIGLGWKQIIFIRTKIITFIS